MDDESQTTTRTKEFFRKRYTTEPEWQRFSEKHAPRIRRWVRMMDARLNQEDRENVAQDVLADLWNAFKKGSKVWDPDKGVRLRTWLRKVTRNAMLDYKERFLRRRPQSSKGPDAPGRAVELVFDDELIQDVTTDDDDLFDFIANQETVQLALDVLHQELIARERREQARRASATGRPPRDGVAENFEPAESDSTSAAELKFLAFSHWFERKWKAKEIARELAVKSADVSRWLYDMKGIFRKIVIDMGEPDPFPEK